MSAHGITAGAPTAHAPPASAGSQAETCPLCGSPLAVDQEWCLRCGAAARTRLAASPNWKGPLLTVAAVVALSFGVLAAALVKLAGDSSAPARTTTITTAQAATIPAVTTPTAATPTASTPTATTPGTGTSRTTSTSTTGTNDRTRTGASTQTGAQTRTGTALNGVGGLLEKRLRDQRRKAGK